MIMVDESLRKILEIYPALDAFVTHVEEYMYPDVVVKETEDSPLPELSVYGELTRDESPFVSISIVKDGYHYAFLAFGLNPAHPVICYRRRNWGDGMGSSFRPDRKFNAETLLSDSTKLIDLYDQVFGDPFLFEE